MLPTRKELSSMALVCFEVEMKCAPNVYIPFDNSTHTHSVRVGFDAASPESGLAKAMEYALSVFPLAGILNVWHITLGRSDRIKKLWSNTGIERVRKVEIIACNNNEMRVDIYMENSRVPSCTHYVKDAAQIPAILESSPWMASCD